MNKEITMAGNIPVYCAFDAILPLDELKSNPRNPNNHPAKQITLLTKIIKEQGWRNPIVVSTRSGLIVKGHGRLQAAYEGDMGFAPVDYQHYESEEAEHADMIADNKIAELAEMSEEILGELLSEMAETDFDLSLTGFDGEELDSLLASMSDDMEEDDGEDEEEDKELPRVPLSRPGDIWTLGVHTLEVGDTYGDDLLVVDVMVGLYMETTGNVAVTCQRDGETIPYMQLIREWAERNGCVDMLYEQKIPILKFKK